MQHQIRKHLSFIAVTVSLLIAPPLLAQDESNCSPAPNTSLSPQDVVKTVVDALRNNDKNNSGIAIVYCFASPGNKSSTGPLPRFTAMIQQGYSEMLNHSYSHFEEMQIKDDTALQATWLVTADGREYGYLFTIGKQKSGKYADMWMTEAVYPLRRPGSGQGLGI